MTRSKELEIDEILKRFKGYTARQANKILSRKGEFWMDDYFDRWMRNERYFRKTVAYIELNPVKAGLCAKPEDWPLVVRGIEVTSSRLRRERSALIAFFYQKGRD